MSGVLRTKKRVLSTLRGAIALTCVAAMFSSVIALAPASLAEASTLASVGNETALREAFSNPSVGTVSLTNNIELRNCNIGPLSRETGVPVTVLGNGFSVTQTCSGPSADLSVTKTAPASVFIGRDFTYTITIGNVGEVATTTPSTIVDVLPASMTYKSASAGCSFASGSRTVTCVREPPLGPDATATYTITAAYSGTAGNVTNTATVSNAEDGNPTNNTSSATTSFTQAQTINNPGTFVARAYQGTIKIGATTYNLPVCPLGQPPPVGGCVTLRGSANNAGTLTFSEVSFPPFDIEALPGLFATVSIQPTSTTGTLNPGTGESVIDIRFTLRLSGANGLIPNTCAVPNLRTRMVTGNSGALTGTPYSQSTGYVAVVDNATLALPNAPASGANSCGALATTIDSILGLPSPAGQNEARMSFAFTPVFTGDAVAAVSSFSQGGSGDNTASPMNADASYGVFSSSSQEVLTLRNIVIQGGVAVRGAGVYSVGPIALDGVTISGGTAEYGGAVYSEGSVTVVGSTFTDNKATSGGAIASQDGLNVSGSTFQRNQSTEFGGAITTRGAGSSISIFESSFTDNTSGDGGAIYVLPKDGVPLSVATISDSTFARNQSAGFGGAVSSNGLPMTVGSSSFDGNVADASGGGIFMAGAAGSTGSDPVRQDHQLTVTNSTFTGNQSKLTTGGGGAISSPLTTVTGGAFTNNSALGSGGAVFAGALTATGGTFTGNTSGADGGALRVARQFTVTDGTYRSNTAGTGGGVLSTSASGAISNSTFTENRALGGFGGAIRTFPGGVSFPEPVLSVANSTVSKNSATVAGGGIASFGPFDGSGLTITENTASEGAGLRVSSSGTLRDSTVAGNSATGLSGGISALNLTLLGSTISGNSSGIVGGGIGFLAGSKSSITNSTITGNSSKSGGGLHSAPASSGTNTLILSYVTLAGNEAITAANLLVGGATTLFGSVIDGDAGNCELTSATGDYNYRNGGGCAIAGTGNILDGPPSLLGTLGNNGGVTQTLVPAAGSPLIGAIPSSACSGRGITTDQRGSLRPPVDGSDCDMGAVEVAPLVAPGTPGKPVAVPGDGQAIVTVVAPSSGGSVASYTVTGSPDGQTCVVTVPASFCVVTGLANGTAYTFQATATGTGGTSSPSVASDPVTPNADGPAPPGIPGKPTATAGDRQATVTIASAAAGGPVTGYTVASLPGNLTCTVTPPATSCVVTGLTNGTAYTFRVTATGPGGATVGPVLSDPVTPNADGPAPPGVPGKPTATAGDGQATVGVVSPTSGGPVASYTVTSSPAGRTCVVTSPATSCTFTGLTNGVAYTFTVVASGEGGDSGVSEASDPVVPTPSAPTPPSVPNKPTAAPGDSQVTVTVGPPSAGGQVDNYLVTTSPSGRTCVVTPPATSCVVTGLANGTSYTFQVTAIGPGGTSSPSGASDPATPASDLPPAPASPGKPAAVAGDQQATVTVSPSVGGGPVSAYVVTTSPGGRTCFVTPPATSCTFTGLTNGVAYTFTVVASGEGGDSGVSEASDPVTPNADGPAPPEVPGKPSAIIGDRQAQITVTPAGSPSGSPSSREAATLASVGGPVTSYLVTASPGERTCSITTTSYTCVIKGLTNETVYTFTVTATGPGGTSLPSVPSDEVVPTTASLCAPFPADDPSALADGFGDSTLTTTLPSSGAIIEVVHVGEGGLKISAKNEFGQPLGTLIDVTGNYRGYLAVQLRVDALSSPVSTTIKTLGVEGDGWWSLKAWPMSAAPVAPNGESAGACDSVIRVTEFEGNAGTIRVKSAGQGPFRVAAYSRDTARGQTLVEGDGSFDESVSVPQGLSYLVGRVQQGSTWETDELVVIPNDDPFSPPTPPPSGGSVLPLFPSGPAVSSAAPAAPAGVVTPRFTG